MKQNSQKKAQSKKKIYVKPEAKVTKIALGVWAGSCSGSCLSPQTKISTPNGLISVKNLKLGDLVYTQNKKGNKIASPIIEKSKVKVSSSHKMVQMKMLDGRSLIASPDHPATGIKTVRELFKQEPYDNSVLQSVDLISYDYNHTYDILPEGDTGYYWANEILIGSTLYPEELSPIALALKEVQITNI